MKLYTKKQLDVINMYKLHYKVMGDAFFECIKQYMDVTMAVGVVCGGDDKAGFGYLLAKRLFLCGYKIEVVALVSSGDMNDFCLEQYQQYTAIANVFVDDIKAWDWLIDAMIDVDSQPMSSLFDDSCRRINTVASKVISIESPSGVNTSNGMVKSCAVNANVVLTSIVDKPGFYVYPGRLYAKNVHIVEIKTNKPKLDEVVVDTYLIRKDEMKQLLPERKMHSNKGTYGKVLCVGGSYEMCGAISLASLAALRSGCGLVTCVIPACIYPVVANRVLESTYMVLESHDGKFSKDAVATLQEYSKTQPATCILLGCGIGRSDLFDSTLYQLLETDNAFLVDADGLYALRHHLSSLQRKADLILTPHLKEFATLFNIPLPTLVNQPLTYIRKISRQYPSVVFVVKSETTYIAKNGILYLNTYGNNGLAKGGSGDVLAGIIAGIYAQTKHALHAAILGVFLHAYSADQLLLKKTTYSIIPSDIFLVIDDIIKSLEEEI